MKHFTFKEAKIYLGEDKHENWNLLETSQPDNFFVHLNSFPSGHIKIQTNHEINQEIILYAGDICKKHSKYKNLKNLKICYCKYSNLLKGEKVGEVLFKSNRQVKKITLN